MADKTLTRCCGVLFTMASLAAFFNSDCCLAGSGGAFRATFTSALPKPIAWDGSSEGYRESLSGLLGFAGNGGPGRDLSARNILTPNKIDLLVTYNVYFLKWLCNLGTVDLQTSVAKSQMMAQRKESG